MPDATEMEIILCKATCLPQAVSSDDLYTCHILLQCPFFSQRLYVDAGRSSLKHIIDTCIFVKYLKQFLPPPISSGGQERLANESQKTFNWSLDLVLC